MLEGRRGLKLDEFRALVMVAFINDRVSSFWWWLVYFKCFGVFHIFEGFTKST